MTQCFEEEHTAIAPGFSTSFSTAQRLLSDVASPGSVEIYSHSHSIVAGGFPEMSYVTREMPGTSLMMRRDTWSKKSYGSRAQRAVMKSTV